MSTQSVLTGAEAASFKGISINAQLVEWTDTRQYRHAVHEFLKVDGAKVEPMGRRPFSCRMNLFFVGPNWRADLTKFLSSVDRDPTGVLVHPAFGSIDAFCQGTEGGSMNVENARDMYVLPVSFIENNVNQRLTETLGQGVPAAQQNTSSMSQSLMLAMDRLQGAVAKASISTFVDSVTEYVLLTALSTFVSVSQDVTGTVFGTDAPSMDQQLAIVRDNANSAKAAIIADPTSGVSAAALAAGTASATARTYEMIALVEQTFAACLELDAAIRKNKPVLQKYTVPGMMHIGTLAGIFYGSDGPSRIPEILVNNRGKIPTPAAIRKGTVLLMAPPTV